MDADNIFYIQSMTKPIITVAFMTLYEEGYFFLDDPVSKYLPAFKDLKVAVDPADTINRETVPTNREVTIAHLLSHTAGFSHGLGGTRLDQDIARALYYQPHENIESRVNALTSMPLYGQPGEQWYYSASPDVLALLIEKFSGKSPDVFLQERVFDPLGMKDTGYNLTKKQQRRCAQVHYINDEGNMENVPRQTPMDGNKVFGGTHGLFSTALDYMKFCQMMLDQGELNGVRILSPKTIEIMRINQVGDLDVSPGNGFGFGFGVLTDLADNKATGSVGQYYWSGAYCTYFFIDPEEDLIAVLMMQMAPYSNYYPKKMRQFIYATMVD
jgi:CubicO group peptidase (beta-lactamase class C family)